MRAILLAAIVAACSGAPTKPVASSVASVAAVAAPVAAPVPAPAPPPSPVDPDAPVVPTWSAIHTGTLPNGLTYYILPNPKPARRARFWLAVNAGSIQEDDDQRGVAHLVEHMAFNGTKHFPKNDLVAYLERIGMRFGADIDAATSFDHTIYKLEVPLDDPAYADNALQMLRDWAGDITFDPVEIGAPGTATKERGVVLEEWRSKRGAAARLRDKQIGVLLDGTQYPARVPIGTPESIENVSRDAIVRFYKDWYRPDLMAVIVVGDLRDVAAIEQQIRARFADLTAPAKPRPHANGGFPAAGVRISIESDPEAAGTAIEITAFAPLIRDIARRDYRQVLARRLYTRILRDRLSALAREGASPVISGTASIDHAVEGVDAFSVRVGAKQGRTDEALRALLAEVARIERQGVTPGELDRARAAMLHGYDVMAERIRESASLCDEITRLYFDSEEMSGPIVERELAHELLPKLTAADLAETMTAFAGATNRAVLISGPDASALPSRDRVLAAIDDVGTAELAPWQDRPPPDELMTALPTPGRIVHETKLDKIGAVEWTLSNGAEIVVKPTDFEADAVLLEGAAPGGEALASDKEFANARFANSVASALGVGALDAGAMRDVLGTKQISVSTSIFETRQTIHANGTARDLEAMLQLVHLRMTAPHEDPDEMAAWQQRVAEAFSDTWHIPEVAFLRDITAALYGHNARRDPPDPTAIAGVDPAKALAFYKARFGDASGFKFVIVGTLDLATLRPLVERYIASLPGSGHAAPERDLGVRKAHGVVVKRWRHGSDPKALVQIEFHGDQAWSREADDDALLLGEVLRMRLRDVLREDLGGVYDVRVAADLERRPHPSRTVLISFGCDPGRVEELVKATLAETASLAKQGPPSDYVDRVREQYTRAHQKIQRLNGSWLDWLAAATRYGDDPALFLDASHVLARATPDHVRDAARRLLDPSQYFEGVLLPEDAK